MTTSTPNMPNKIKSMLPTLVLVLVAAAVAYVVYVRWTDRPWTRNGQVRADIVKIAPRVTGYIVEVAVEDNQFVREGELLFRIDPSSYQLTVDTAEVQLDQAREDVAALEAAVAGAQAQVAEAEAGVTSARNAIAKARAGVESAAASVAEAKAGEATALTQITRAEALVEEMQRESDRAQRLLDDRAGSREDAQRLAAAVAGSRAALEGARASSREARSGIAQAEAVQREAEAEVTIAESTLAEAVAALATANAGLAHATASLGERGDANVRVRAAVVALERARLELSWTSMHAPFDGFVTNLDVNEGVYGSPGTPIAAFVDSNSFRVDGYFQENKLRHIRPGDPAIVTLMSHPDVEVAGIVDSIGYAIDPPNVADTEGVGHLVPQVEPTFDWVRLPQRVPVRIRLEDVPEDIQLVSGMTASVAIRPQR